MRRVGTFVIAISLMLAMIGCGDVVDNRDGNDNGNGVEYILAVISTDGGRVTEPGEGIRTYDEGTVVELVATPDTNYQFINWIGDVGTIADANDASTTITMYGDYIITGNFAETGEEPEFDEFRAIDSSAYLLVGRSSGYEALHPEYFGGGLLGGDMPFVYSRLELYIDEIRAVDSVILFNTSAEDAAILEEWPDEYRFLFPFDVHEFYAIELPFGYFKEDEDGYLRGILMADEARDIINLGTHLAENEIPVGQPYTLRIEFRIDSPCKNGWKIEYLVLEGEDFDIVYPEGYIDDAELVYEWAQDYVLPPTEEYFGEIVEAIPEKVTVRLLEFNGIRPGMAYAEHEPPAMVLPLPSLAYEESTFYDSIWFIGNIAHEFNHILYEVHSREVTGAWSWDRVPSWFREGLAEYHKFLVVGKETFQERWLGNYLEWSKENILDEGLDYIEGSVYSGGAIALIFLHETEGFETIKAIMKSDTYWFWDIVEEETDYTETEFEHALIDWLLTFDGY